MAGRGLKRHCPLFHTTAPNRDTGWYISNSLSNSIWEAISAETYRRESIADMRREYGHGMRNVRRNAAASVAAATSIAIASVLLLPSTQAGAETVQGLQQSYKDASDRYQALLIESDAASEQLNDANARLDEANAKMGEARDRYDSARETLSQLIKSEYIGGSQSMNAISAVLGTKNLTSLISASTATETVSRKQAKSVDDARKAKESLDRTVEEANAAKSAAEAAKSELDGKIGEASAYRDSLSDDIRSQIESDTVGGMSGDTAAAQSLIDYYSSGGTYPKNPATTTTQGSSVTEEQRKKILIAALSKVGKTTYVWGASGPDAYDCSGLVQYAYAAAGLKVPHSSASDRAMCNVKPISELEAGDMVFWDGHVAIYAGNGQTIESMPGHGVVMFRIWGQPIGGGQPY